MNIKYSSVVRTIDTLIFEYLFRITFNEFSPIPIVVAAPGENASPTQRKEDFQIQLEPFWKTPWFQQKGHTKERFNIIFEQHWEADGKSLVCAAEHILRGNYSDQIKFSNFNDSIAVWWLLHHSSMRVPEKKSILCWIHSRQSQIAKSNIPFTFIMQVLPGMIQWENVIWRSLWSWMQRCKVVRCMCPEFMADC